jgi:ketosteroid isomerase-like protein
VTAVADRELVHELFAAMSTRRFADAVALFSPDGTWWMLSSRTAVPVADWFSGYARVAQEVFGSGIEFRVNSMIAGENRVAAQVESQARLPNGTDFNNSYHFLLEIDGDRIRKVWEYGDTLYAERILRGGA